MIDEIINEIKESLVYFGFILNLISNLLSCYQYQYVISISMWILKYFVPITLLCQVSN